MNKDKTKIYVNSYGDHTISIPFSRLREFLKPGDIVKAFLPKFPQSYYKIGYKVTQVNHWGVFAVCTDEMAEWAEINKHDSMKSMRGHHKIKWCHIDGVIFQENIGV